jgi:hypothetical protein
MTHSLVFKAIEDYICIELTTFFQHVLALSIISLLFFFLSLKSMQKKLTTTKDFSLKTIHTTLFKCEVIVLWKRAKTLRNKSIHNSLNNKQNPPFTICIECTSL